MGNQPAEHAILGLLRVNRGSAYGYDLMRRFTKPDPLAEIIHLSQSMLYQHLKKLARLGWIVIETEQQSGRPAKQTCKLTPDGEQELDRWLCAPVAHTREIRLEFLVKLYIVRLIEPSHTAALVDDQLEVCRRWRDSLSAQITGLSVEERPETGNVRGLVLRLRLAQTETALEWLSFVRSMHAGAKVEAGSPGEPT